VGESAKARAWIWRSNHTTKPEGGEKSNDTDKEKKDLCILGGENPQKRKKNTEGTIGRTPLREKDEAPFSRRNRSLESGGAKRHCKGGSKRRVKIMGRGRRGEKVNLSRKTSLGKTPPKKGNRKRGGTPKQGKTKVGKRAGTRKRKGETTREKMHARNSALPSARKKNKGGEKRGDKRKNDSKIIVRHARNLKGFLN